MKTRLLYAAAMAVMTVLPVVAAADTQQGCFTYSVESDSWINSCRHTVYGNYRLTGGSCTAGPGYSGDVGPVKAGATSYNPAIKGCSGDVNYCNYDDFIKGTCSPYKHK